MSVAGPNADQVTYWNEQGGPRWVAEQNRLDRMIARYGEAVVQALAPNAGERVIDVGCGCGDTTLGLARHVGPTGDVLGVDISAPMLARARERGAASGLAHVRFVEADAQIHPFPPGGTDAVFSRFGVMFFVDPIAAFANLRAALAPSGRLGFVCWQGLPVNPWMLVPLMALAEVMALPPPPPPEAPGPFAFADPARVEGILADAGFRDVAIEPFTPEAVLGGGGALDEAVGFALDLGPTAAVLRQAPPDVRSKAAAAVREALAPYVTPRGVVLSSAAWIVTARR